MRTRTRTVAFVAGILLSFAAGVAGGAGRPSFAEAAAHQRNDPWHADPCAPHRPITGICRMLRPVTG
ncbi:hypothetical protein [Luteibacter yeojuensis]|uniref:Uncharacterized protein n=1 Tax=Luteibacter yeojuensis TaxID=345309 RepID=A0A7X5QV10_9GAMM|nr:hypothetical protein [Luteibacter yeojuensis]NID15926.1 hypothetical protein [Luteibacter yeojuensis]